MSVSPPLLVYLLIFYTFGNLNNKITRIPRKPCCTVNSDFVIKTEDLYLPYELLAKRVISRAFNHAAWWCG